MLYMMSNRINIGLDHKVYTKLKDKGKFGESFSELVARILEDSEKHRRDEQI